jgi:hypothetical protein
MGYALEFPHFFDFCSRFQRHETGPGATPNEAACEKAGDAVMGLLVQVIEGAVVDGSIAPSVAREPLMLAFSLWAFTHGIVQITVAKGGDLAHHGVRAADFGNYAFELLHALLRGGRP